MGDLKDGYLEGLYEGEPYVSGEQPGAGAVKLNTNENPYLPAPGVMKVLREFGIGKLRLYPKQDGGALREALADYHGVGKENIFVGNGSDEVLAFAFKACFGTERPVFFPDVTYSFYPVWCRLFNIPFETKPLDENFLPDPQDYSDPNGGIVLCEPNAPTGIAAGEVVIKKIIQKNGGSSVIIIDEAYADFADYSLIPYVAEAPNLLVTRSFSKGRSLAGVRVGYAVGSERLTRALTAAKDSFNSYPVDMLAEALGASVVGDEAFYRQSLERVLKTRGEATERLRALGFDVPDSKANFVFAGCGSAARAREIFEYLRDGGVYVRYFDAPRIDDRLRVSIGAPDEMEAFFARLEGYLAL